MTDAPRIKPCLSCLAPNESPWFFCEACGAPRAKWGRWRASFILSAAMMAFMGLYFFRIDYADFFPWPWPLYLLMAFLFTQFTLSLAHDSFKLKARFLTWLLIFLTTGGVVFHLYKASPDSVALAFMGPEALVDILTDPDLYMITYPVIAALLAIVCIPAYIRWGRIYGWTNAYRILLMMVLTTAAIILGLFHLASWIHATNLLPTITEDLEPLVNVSPLYMHFLEMLIVVTFRVMVFEILLVSAAKGYTSSRQSGSKPPRKDLGRESGLVRAVYQVIQILRMFMQTLDQMLRNTIEILQRLVLDLLRVFLALLREILLPTAALLACVAIMCALAVLTDQYIMRESVGGYRSPLFFLGDFLDAGRWMLIGKILLGALILMACLMVFLFCKSSYRWRRIAAFYAELSGWLLPNLLVFFLVMSLSLFASSAAINKYDADTSLPFRFGLMSKVALLILSSLILFMLVRKRSLFLSADDENSNAASTADLEQRDLDRALDDIANALERSGGVDLDKFRSTAQQSLAKSSAGTSASTGVAPETPSSQHTGISELAGRTVASARQIVGDAGGRRMRALTADFSERLKGRPPEIKVMRNLQEERRRKSAQIKALEMTRNAISADTFQLMHGRYSLDLKRLNDRIMQISARLIQTRETELIEKQQSMQEFESLKAQERELLALQQASAVDAREFRRRNQEIQAQLLVNDSRRVRCENRLAFIQEAINSSAGQDS